MDEGTPIKDILTKTLYVDFYSAMVEDNYELSKLTIEEYVKAKLEFRRLMSIKSNGTERQIEDLKVDISLLNNCLIIFSVLGADEENLKIIKRLGVELDANLSKLIENISSSVKVLLSKYYLLNGTMPDLSNIVKLSGEDMIAELSLAIDMLLPMDISLLNYISYHKAAKRKGESIKKAKKNGKHRGY